MLFLSNKCALLFIWTTLLLFTQSSWADSDNCRSESPDVCPEWMPSTADIAKTIKAYNRQLIKEGILELDIGPVIHTSMSTISCGALGQQRASGFVCGGAMTYWDLFGRKDVLQFSPTLRVTDSGNIAIYAFGKWVEPDI